jgi:hypothetical protein
MRRLALLVPLLFMGAQSRCGVGSEPCSVVKDPLTGAATITCPDGSSTVVEPAALDAPDGGVGCSVTRDGQAGTLTVTCADGTTATVADGVAGPSGPAGATGPQGSPGAEGPQGPQGPTGLNWRGPWSASTAYAVPDAVFHAGSAWIATVSSTGDEPGLVSSWQVLASGGAAGLQGPQGAPGPQGLAGDKGDKGDKGDTGAQGPAGATDVLDASGTRLGTAIGASDDVVTVLTSTGHLATLRWDGSHEPAPVVFSGSTCSGAAFLSSRALEPRQLFSRRVVSSRLTGLVYLPVSTSSTTVSHGSQDNLGACQVAAGSVHGWALSVTTPADIGLPSSITGPLTLQ